MKGKSSNNNNTFHFLLNRSGCKFRNEMYFYELPRGCRRITLLSYHPVFYRISKIQLKSFTAFIGVNHYQLITNISMRIKERIFGGGLIERTECPRRNVPDFGRVFLMLKYTDVTQNTYVQNWTVTEITRENVFFGVPRTVPVSWQSYRCRVLECGVILRRLSTR
jgi:hypothetical protein